MYKSGNGARRRNAATGEIQALSAVQPSTLTHGIPPSPAGAMSNLSGSSPGRPQDRFRSKTALSSEQNCTIYFLAGAGLIKIGVSSNPTSRIRAIRNSSPVPIDVLALMPGFGLFMEMRLHQKFNHLRRHGEWFEDNGEIRAEIDRLVPQERADNPQSQGDEKGSIRTFGPCLEAQELEK